MNVILLNCRCYTDAMCASQAREPRHVRTSAASESTTSRNIGRRGGIKVTGIKVRVGYCLSRRLYRGADDDRQGSVRQPAGAVGGDIGCNMAMTSTAVVEGSGSVIVDVDKHRQQQTEMPPASSSCSTMKRSLTHTGNTAALHNTSTPRSSSSYSNPTNLAQVMQTGVFATLTKRNRNRHQQHDHYRLHQLCHYQPENDGEQQSDGQQEQQQHLV